MRKKERGGRVKGKGERDGMESLRGKGGEGKRRGKRGGEGKFRGGGRPPKCFFLERPRLATFHPNPCTRF